MSLSPETVNDYQAAADKAANLAAEIRKFQVFALRNLSLPDPSSLSAPELLHWVEMLETDANVLASWADEILSGLCSLVDKAGFLASDIDDDIVALPATPESVEA